MRLLFWSKKRKEAELEQKRQDALKIHQNTITNIVQSREPANALIRAIEQNQIVIQIAGVIGSHR